MLLLHGDRSDGLFLGYRNRGGSLLYLLLLLLANCLLLLFEAARGPVVLFEYVLHLNVVIIIKHFFSARFFHLQNAFSLAVDLLRLRIFFQLVGLNLRIVLC